MTSFFLRQYLYYMNVITKLLFITSAVLLVSCSAKQSYENISDLNDRHIAFLKQDVTEENVMEIYPDARVTEYDKIVSLFLDMEANRCDAVAMSESAADMVVKRNQDYVILGIANTSDGGSIHVVVPREHVWSGKDSITIENIGFFKKIENSLRRNLFNEKALHLIWGGFKTTIAIFFFGAVFAMTLGIFLTYLSISHKCQWFYKPLSWFVMTIHDVPSVVLMMFFFYVIFGGAMNGVFVSIIALGIYSSGSLHKVFKIHISNVGKEQLEAGRMLGLSTFKCYRYIILPQAVKTMLPFVGSEMKILLRATSYAGYIAQKDLIKAVDAIREFTYDAFMPLLLVSLLYLLLSWLIVKILDFISTKLFNND